MSLDISVVIPTCNRPAQLAQCLESLARQTFPADRFEILVADDASSVPLDLPAHVQCVRLPVNAGPGAARNQAANVAHGKLLAFTDDDCLPAPNWLAELWSQHEATPEALLGGRIINALKPNLCAEASQVISNLVYAHYNAHAAQARFFSSNNIAVPREIFLEMGGFDAAFRIAAEDRELCDRWRHAGKQLLYAPDAVIVHAHDLTLRSFTRQHFSYGRGAHRYHKLRAARGSGQMRQDMAFHAKLLPNIRTQLAQIPLQRAVPLLALLALWQVANAAGYFYEKLFIRGG